MEPNALLPTTTTTFRLCLPNMPLNVPASTTLISTSPFPTTQASNPCLAQSGGQIALRFRSWQRWREISTLVTPASGSPVERLFSVSGRIATWQRLNRLCDSTISMMYKAAMNLRGLPMLLEEEERCYG